MNDKLRVLYKMDLFPSLEIDASCTKHDKGNACKAAQAAAQRTRAPYPELKHYRTTTAAETFIIRKFKRTSLYPHQKSYHLIAHVYSRFGRNGMLFLLYLFKNCVYCRGQRELNLMANHQWFLLLICYGFVDKLNEITYDKKRVLSKQARAVISPIISHKHIQMEMVINGMLFRMILYPLLTIMSGESVQSAQREIVQILDDTQKNVGSKGRIWFGFGVMFGFANYSKSLHGDLSLNLKLFTDRKHKQERDTLVKSRKIYHIKINYASEIENDDKSIEWYKVVNFMRNVIKEMGLESMEEWCHSHNSKYSIAINTEHHAVSIQIITAYQPTQQQMQQQRIEQIIQSVINQKLNFKIFILWDSFELEEAGVLDEAEPLFAVNESYQIMKRLTLIHCISNYNYLKDDEEGDEDEQKDLTVLKNLMFRQAQSYFGQYHERHYIHCHGKQEDDGKEEIFQDEESKNEEAGKVEEENISFSHLGKSIDFGFHVNGIMHYCLSRLSYAKLYWLLRLVKSRSFSFFLVNVFAALFHTVKGYNVDSNIVSGISRKIEGIIQRSIRYI